MIRIEGNMIGGIFSGRCAIECHVHRRLGHAIGLIVPDHDTGTRDTFDGAGATHSHIFLTAPVVEQGEAKVCAQGFHRCQLAIAGTGSALQGVHIGTLLPLHDKISEFPGIAGTFLDIDLDPDGLTVLHLRHPGINGGGPVAVLLSLDRGFDEAQHVIATAGLPVLSPALGLAILALAHVDHGDIRPLIQHVLCIQLPQEAHDHVNGADGLKRLNPGMHTLFGIAVVRSGIAERPGGVCQRAKGLGRTIGLCGSRIFDRHDLHLVRQIVGRSRSGTTRIRASGCPAGA